MITSILQSQKNSLPRLESDGTVQREIFAQAHDNLDHNLIKLITGPRRVGKSTLAFQLLKDQHYGYVNFDDPDILKNVASYSEPTEAIDAVYNAPEFLFLDEVQNAPDWELYLNSLHRSGKNLVVTGSNARLLSRDIATVLTGRALEIQMLPFSLPEAQLTKAELSLDEYLLESTYPEVLVKAVDPGLYYQSLFDTSIVKDILVRFSLRNPLEFENLVKYFLSSIGSQYSYHSVHKKTGLSVPTVSSYIEYLQDTFLFYELPFFSYKQSEINRNNKKMYAVDFAFSKYITAPLKKNKGMALENAVFVQLLRKEYAPGRNMFYFQSSAGEEVDFLLVQPDGSLCAIQVAYTLEDETTLAREIRGFDSCEAQLGPGLKKILVSAVPPADNERRDIVHSSFSEFCGMQL